jgi:hypothetical protein
MLAINEPPMLTRRSTRVRQASVSFKAKARQTTYERYNNDESFRSTRDALINTKVRKFPGYGTFKGIITSYYPTTDTCHLLFDDGDEETDSYEEIQMYIEGTAEYDQEHKTALALTISLDAAITSAATMTPTAAEPNHYKDAMTDTYSTRAYKELIGSLLFLQTGTIPEISCIVSVLARYMTKAGEPHMAAAKKVLRYLQSRKKVPLQWCAIDNALPGIIHGYPDASFADIPDTRLSSAAQECLFLRKLCIEMGFHQHRPTFIYEDCESAVALSKETCFRKRSKHIALK